MGTSSLFSKWVLIAYMLSVKASSHDKLFGDCIVFVYIFLFSPVLMTFFFFFFLTSFVTTGCL